MRFGWELALRVVVTTGTFDADALFSCEVAMNPSGSELDLHRFDEVINAAMTPELATYRALVLTCEKVAPVPWESALRMFVAMESEAQVVADDHMYAAIIRVLCAAEGPMWEHAVAIAMRPVFRMGTCQSYFLKSKVPEEVMTKLAAFKGA